MEENLKKYYELFDNLLNAYEELLDFKKKNKDFIEEDGYREAFLKRCEEEYYERKRCKCGKN